MSPFRTSLVNTCPKLQTSKTLKKPISPHNTWKFELLISNLKLHREISPAVFLFHERERERERDEITELLRSDRYCSQVPLLAPRHQQQLPMLPYPHNLIDCDVDIVIMEH